MGRGKIRVAAFFKPFSKKISCNRMNVRKSAVIEWMFDSSEIEELTSIVLFYHKTPCI